MSTYSLSRGFSIGMVILGLLFGAGLVPRAASAGAASADDLRALVARDGWVLVRVELASALAGISAATHESEAPDAAVENLLLGLPVGSYTDVERLTSGSTLSIRVDPAGLDALLASAEVVRITSAAMPVAMRRVAAGGDHSLALKTDETLWAWGWNFYGQLGDGTWAADRLKPVPVRRFGPLTP